MFNNDSEFNVFSSMASVNRIHGTDDLSDNFTAINKWVSWQSFFQIISSTMQSDFFFLQTSNQSYNSKAIHENVIALNLFFPCILLSPIQFKIQF